MLVIRNMKLKTGNKINFSSECKDSLIHLRREDRINKFIVRKSPHFSVF